MENSKCNELTFERVGVWEIFGGFLYGHNFYVHIATCFACCLTLPVFKINIISQTPCDPLQLERN